MTVSSEEAVLPGDADSAAVRQVIAMFRASPFPTTLQDPSFRFVQVNAAFVAFVGRSREDLLGRDFVDLLPEEDRQATLENRKRFLASGGQVEGAFLAEGRLVDAAGQRRWFRAARSVVSDERGEPLYLAVLQDTTSENEARERADRSAREIDDWFDLSPVGMVLFDDSGLLVRTNLAFDEMTGSVPVSLAEASPSLAALLAWGKGGALQALKPGSRPIESQGWVTRPGGQMRRLRAIVRCYRTAGGERRFMGVVEDRSIEEERDLAQMQIGAMMDTAGVGIATFQESSGWTGRRPTAASGGSALLQNISRDVVAADSLPEYERLQQALKRTQRAEVRYAIEHPELGRRWLLTRVEPATLASGKKTASVVTLDVTEQQRSQVRSDQLLREMTTILESTTAGIAYLRGGTLVRCNRRFETMLRLPPGTSAGATLAELLARHPDAEAMATESRDALVAGVTYEIEFAFGAGEGDEGGERASGRAAPEQRWFSLSVRSAGAGGDRTMRSPCSPT